MAVKLTAICAVGIECGFIPAVGSDRGREGGDVVGVFLPELSQLGEWERGHGVDRLSGVKHTHTHFQPQKQLDKLLHEAFAIFKHNSATLKPLLLIYLYDKVHI